MVQLSFLGTSYSSLYFVCHCALDRRERALPDGTAVSSPAVEIQRTAPLTTTQEHTRVDRTFGTIRGGRLVQPEPGTTPWMRGFEHRGWRSCSDGCYVRRSASQHRVRICANKVVACVRVSTLQPNIRQQDTRQFASAQQINPRGLAAIRRIIGAVQGSVKGRGVETKRAGFSSRPSRLSRLNRPTWTEGRAEPGTSRAWAFLPCRLPCGTARASTPACRAPCPSSRPSGCRCAHQGLSRSTPSDTARGTSRSCR